jgi:hypothetical protein
MPIRARLRGSMESGEDQMSCGRFASIAAIPIAMRIGARPTECGDGTRLTRHSGRTL